MSRKLNLHLNNQFYARRTELLRYHDKDPILSLCVEAQQYYEQHSYPTRVKACSVISVEEIMQLAGVAAFTIAPGLLQSLSETNEPIANVAPLSLFKSGTQTAKHETPRLSFIDDEARYRKAFAARDGGKGQLKTKQVIIAGPFERGVAHLQQLLGNRPLLRVSDQGRGAHEG